MIVFKPKAAPPTPDDGDANRFDQVRKAARDGHRKSDADTARRLADKKPEDDRLL